MRKLTLKLMLAVAVSSVALATARAEELRRVEVSAPAINCLFDPNCRVVVSDSSDIIPIAASGPNFLQSRTFRGRRGSVAEGLFVYQYRIDLRRATGIVHIPCLDSLSIDFGPVVRTLDLDGNGNGGDEVFVVTRGGIGIVGIASAEKTGNTITFRFENSVCAGGRPGDGQSTFFFGLVSTHAPVQTTATIVESTGRTYEVRARAPRQKDPLHDGISQGASVKNPIPFPDGARAYEVNGGRLVPLQKREVNEAVVDSLAPQPCVERGGRVNVFGSGFGRQQGERVLKLGGHAIGVPLQITGWSDRHITAVVPNDRRIEFGQWYYVGLQNHDGNWVSNISRTINICRRLE